MGDPSLEWRSRADEVAQGVVSTLADSSTVLLVTGDSLLAPVAMRHASGARTRAIEEALRARYRCGEGIPGRVWQTGQPVVLNDLSEAPELARLRDSSFGTASVLVAPLLYGKQNLGILALGVVLFGVLMAHSAMTNARESLRDSHPAHRFRTAQEIVFWSIVCGGGYGVYLILTAI